MKIKGFTLIEMVVVIGIMAILGLILTNVLVQTLRGQNKVKILNQVKQNGQVVLDKLTNEIRQAKSIVCINKNMNNVTPGNRDDTIVILKQDNTYSRFRFYPSTGDTNGSIKKINFTQDALKMKDPGQYDPLLCTDNTDFGENPQIITNTDTVGGISIGYYSPKDVNKPIFTRDILHGYADTVTIQFMASAGISAGSAYEDIVKSGGILFTTTVDVRGGR